MTCSLATGTSACTAEVRSKSSTTTPFPSREAASTASTTASRRAGPATAAPGSPCETPPLPQGAPHDLPIHDSRQGREVCPSDEDRYRTRRDPRGGLARGRQPVPVGP